MFKRITLIPLKKLKRPRNPLNIALVCHFFRYILLYWLLYLGQLRSGQCFEPDKPLFWSSPVATDSDDLSESNECFNNSLTQFVTFETL